LRIVAADGGFGSEGSDEDAAMGEAPADMWSPERRQREADQEIIAAKCADGRWSFVALVCGGDGSLASSSGKRICSVSGHERLPIEPFTGTTHVQVEAPTMVVGAGRDT
jgi:hypothetical protein